MTFFFEISKPLQQKPSLFRNDMTVRFVWLLFSIGFVKIDLHELTTKSHGWDYN